MRYVELKPGLRSSRLGFGCASVLGAIDGATARRALEIALAEGITHFDVAPSYGYGEAESWLGRELGKRRDEVVLATKFGIVATPLAQWLRPFKPLVRILRRRRATPREPSSGASTAPKRDLFHRRVPITPLALRGSVETSLRRLRTDRIDWLFLHEPREPLTALDDLAEMANTLRCEGKIRAWGLAYVRATESKHVENFDRFDALQFDLSPMAVDYDEVRRRRSGAPNVIFSVLRDAARDADRGLILRQVAADFPLSVILCSMFNPDHIRANARALS